MSGEMIKTVLEDVADNLFNPDPYYQQGGDMVRVGGLEYTHRAGREDGLAHHRHAAGRQADRGRQDLQGGRLGAGVRGGAATPAASRCGRSSRPGSSRSRAAASSRARINTPTLLGVQGNPGVA